MSQKNPPQLHLLLLLSLSWAPPVSRVQLISAPSVPPARSHASYLCMSFFYMLFLLLPEQKVAFTFSWWFRANGCRKVRKRLSFPGPSAPIVKTWGYLTADCCDGIILEISVKFVWSWPIIWKMGGSRKEVVFCKSHLLKLNVEFFPPIICSIISVTLHLSMHVASLL